MTLNELNHTSDWQYQLSVIASRIRLQLLTGDEVDFLMDKGYFDELMLEIIDDDPLYPKANYTALFEKIWQNLHFPTLNHHHAKLINTFDRLYPFTIRPHNILPLFDEKLHNNDIFYDKFYDLMDITISDEIHIDVTEFQSTLYAISDCIFHIEQRWVGVSALFNELPIFFELCEHWMNSHKTSIIPIINQFPKNPS